MNPAFGRQMRLEHWTTAAEQGAAAVRNALEPGAAKSFSTVPYFWSDWYERRLQFVGVPAADEVEIIAGDIDSGNFLALYRTGARVTGALGLNQRKVVMRMRSAISAGTSWDEAVNFVRENVEPPKAARRSGFDNSQ